MPEINDASLLDLYAEKLSRLKKAYVIETDTLAKFKLKHEIAETEKELDGFFHKPETYRKSFQDDSLLKTLLNSARSVSTFAELSHLTQTIGNMSIEGIDTPGVLSNESEFFLYLTNISGLAKNIIDAEQDSIRRLNINMFIKTVQKMKADHDFQSEWFYDNLVELLDKWQDWAINYKPKKDLPKTKFQEIPNPFIYGNPVRSDQAGVFVGRQDVIEKIQYEVMQSFKPPIFLYGRRRTGKTSALLNLNRYIGRTVTPVYIDLQKVKYRESGAAFCRNLSREIVGWLPRIRREFEALDFEKNPFSTLSDFLDLAERIAAEEERPLLLTFDEYERLEEKDINILDTLREIIQHRQHIVVLVSGSYRFDEQSALRNLPWHDYLINTKTIEISYLDRASALKLLTKPTDDFKLNYPAGMPESIVEMTNGQPFLLQAVAYELVNHLNFYRHSQITDADLETVYQTVLTAADGYFEEIWSRECTDAERSLLERLVCQQSSLPGQEGIASSLIRKEIIIKQNDHWKIVVPLFQRWLSEKKLCLG